ncbi:MAG TPA: choice-of-anchor D domain-containing protein, partial [Usitatibacter sp.]|nr:choice-of-anchor D domain-containing protein [Usitatibacter sp.]
INLLGDSFYSVPANDACDADGGGNGLANYPVLASASSDGVNTTITGTLNSTAATTFRLEFFSSPPSDVAANRSGRVFLGNASIVTDGSCNASFTATVPAGAAVGDDITATSTDPSGNTSSFSNAASVSFSARVASLSLSTASLTFGPQLIGSTSASQRVTLTNNGTASANISNVSVSAGFVESTTCVAVLAPTSACDIDVSFTPTAMGTAAGQLTINSDTLPDPQTVALSGTGAAAPTFSIATFTSRTVGQVSTVTVFIGNRTGNPVTYSGFNVQFVYPAGFVHDGSRAVQESCGTSVTTLGSPTVTGIAATSGSVSPGVTCTAVGSQMFVPTTPGTYTLTIPAGGFTVKSPFAYSNPVPITATVTVTLAATPAVTIAPASLAFGAQAVSTASPSQAVTLTNSGSAALAIRSIAASSEFTQVNGCPASLAAGASCTIDVKFTPTASGPRTGTLSVATNAGGSPHTVGLTGTGTVLAPSVSLSPASVAFASRTVATASAPQTITLANSGNAPLDISSVAITGDFAFASACPSQLAALASCTIDVTFTPLAVGPRAGTVTIASNAPGSPHAVSLTGTGASGLTPVILVSPSALDFVVEPVGRDSAPQVATVTNTGTATLTFATIVVTGDYRQVALPAATPGQACPVDLAPGASCGIAIVFHPAGINLRTGALSITTNAGSVATTVTLAGTGLTPTVPQLSVAANLSFDHQPVGTTSAGKATSIINTSAVLATITELSASGDFSVSDTCTTIVAGATCSPLVFFQPTQAGPRTGTLTIRTLRDMDPYIVALSGTGDQNLRPVLVVSPTRVGFGNALVGSANRVVVMLTNVGQVPVVVETILGTGNFIATHDCGSIPSRASCAVTITYVPGLPGAQQGAVEIRSNAVDSPHRIDVSGVGCLIPSPGRARLAMPLCGP